MKIYWFDISYEKNIRAWAEDLEKLELIELKTRCNDLQIGAGIMDESFQKTFEERWGKRTVDQTKTWFVNGMA